MNDSSGPRGGAYVAQHRVVAAGDRRAGAGGDRPPLPPRTWCSCPRPPLRGPGEPFLWLEPDVKDDLRVLKLARGGRGVVPRADRLRTLNDMEVGSTTSTPRRATAEELELPARASTAGVDPRFVAMGCATSCSSAAPASAANPRKGLRSEESGGCPMGAAPAGAAEPGGLECIGAPPRLPWCRNDEWVDLLALARLTGRAGGCAGDGTPGDRRRRRGTKSSLTTSSPRPTAPPRS